MQMEIEKKVTFNNVLQFNSQELSYRQLQYVTLLQEQNYAVLQNIKTHEHHYIKKCQYKQMEQFQVQLETENDSKRKCILNEQ